MQRHAGRQCARWLALVALAAPVLAQTAPATPGNHPRGGRVPAPPPAPLAANDAVRREVLAPPLPHRRILHLHQAEPDAVSAIVAQLFGGTARVVREPGTGAVVVGADTPDRLAEIGRFIEELDAPPPRVDRQPGRAEAPPAVISLSLRAARAVEVAQRIDHLLPDLPDVRWIADERANLLWLAGTPEAVKPLSELAQRMESEAQAAQQQTHGARTLRFYDVRGSDAERLAQLLGKVLGMRRTDPPARGQPAPEPRLVVEPDAGLVIGFLSDEEDRALREVMQRVQSAGGTTSQSARGPEGGTNETAAGR